jgi:hypothetical protein
VIRRCYRGSIRALHATQLLERAIAAEAAVPLNFVIEATLEEAGHSTRQVRPARSSVP